jgi:hypothetical protein
MSSKPGELPRNPGNDCHYAQELINYGLVEQNKARIELHQKGVWNPTARDIVNECIEARKRGGKNG